jgi:hypothetical protein
MPIVGASPQLHLRFGNDLRLQLLDLPKMGDFCRRETDRRQSDEQDEQKVQVPGDPREHGSWAAHAPTLSKLVNDRAPPTRSSPDERESKRRRRSEVNLTGATAIVMLRSPRPSICSSPASTQQSPSLAEL